MSYCIAFSIDGATDVTRRYVRDAEVHGAERSRCPEAVLMWITNEIKRMRQENMPKEERRRLLYEDQREERELKNYVMQALTTAISRSLPPGAGGPQANGSGGGSAGGSGGEIKVPEARRTGTQAWREARGEAGQQPREGGNGSPPDRSPREGY